MNIIAGHMIVNAALQAEIITRVLAGNFGDAPDRPVHHLGPLPLPNGGTIPLHLRHAADAIIIDHAGQVILITRTHNPGIGKLALPGGFIDALNGTVETPRATAIREAMEETGISLDALQQAAITPLGPRRYNRPFDIRAAWNNLPGTNIKKGDFFAVSTQGFACKFQQNLTTLALNAGDDAAAVHVLKIASLHPDQFAVPDHLTMIHEALGETNEHQ